MSPFGWVRSSQSSCIDRQRIVWYNVLERSDMDETLEGILVNVTGVDRDEGTIIVLNAVETGRDGAEVLIAADRREALNILGSEEFQCGGAPLALVQDWQIIRRFA